MIIQLILPILPINISTTKDCVVLQLSLDLIYIFFKFRFRDCGVYFPPSSRPGGRYPRPPMVPFRYFALPIKSYLREVNAGPRRFLTLTLNLISNSFIYYESKSHPALYVDVSAMVCAVTGAPIGVWCVRYNYPLVQLRSMIVALLYAVCRYAYRSTGPRMGHMLTYAFRELFLSFSGFCSMMSVICLTVNLIN